MASYLVNKVGVWFHLGVREHSITSKLSVGLFDITESHNQLFTRHALLVLQLVPNSREEGGYILSNKLLVLLLPLCH